MWDYVADRAGDDVADRLLLSFDAKLALLAELPGIGRSRDELRPRLRSFPVGPYTLFYRPASDGIELIRVVHAARDLKSIFKAEGDS